MSTSKCPRTILVVCLTVAACLSSNRSATAASEASPIDLGGGVRVRNVEEPFDYFTNSWAVIGLKDYVAGTRITPKGEFVLGDGLLCRPLVGKALRPLNNRISKTLRKGYLPIVITDFIVNDSIRYTIEAFACPMDPADKATYDWPTQDNYLNLVRVSMANLKKAPGEADFGLDWQSKDGTLACTIEAAGESHAQAIVAGGRLLGLAQVRGEATLTADGSLTKLRVRVPPEETARCAIFVPFQAMPHSADTPANRLAMMDFEKCLTATTRFWEDLLARGARIDVPEAKPMNTYKASLVYQFIGRDKGEIHAGEGFYDEQYLRDGAYQSISLAHAGYTKEARQSLEHLLRFQRDDGRFESQKGQLDANGYAIWSLVEYYRLTGDMDWLKRVYPQITKSVQWVEQARRQEKDPNSPFLGILPAAIADGEYLWDGKHHIVGYDWQNLRGIQAAAEAARALGLNDDAAAFTKEFDAYRECILRALEKTGLPYIPPSYEKVGTHWGNLEAIFPTVLIDPHAPRLTATLNSAHRDFGRAADNPGGFIEGTIQWNPPESKAIHPYMSQFVTNSHIIRGDYNEAIDGFYSFLLHTTSTHGFPEGVHYKRREAWSNTVPHLWAAALCVTTLRNMLVRAQGDEVHLLSCVPAHWLDDGREIRVKGAPTHFGKLNLTATTKKDIIALTIDPPDRAPPARTIVHLPPGLAIEEATVDGRPLAADTERTLSLPNELLHGSGVITLRVRRLAVAEPMTFASRVARYLEEEAGDSLKPIPGLVATPSASEIRTAECVKLDLSRVATTNPLTAPFNVPNPGQLLFAGLPFGDQIVCGVPMHILDPAKNDGKALVVLSGADACKDLPREAEVPVGVQGRYLCVLGNVTGWAPGDAGTGPWGAVAEYEIRYVDGTVQKVPLISGRTADDWASPPTATEVEVALRNKPWHLNLMTVALEPKPVKSIVVRDLGTPASPLVAAMTVVR
jgi:hypothetical protein